MTRPYLKPAFKNLTLSDLRMPILAQTGQLTTFSESSTQSYNEFKGGSGLPCIDQGALVFNFNLGGVTPNGDGTLTVSAMGNINAPGESYKIAFEGVGDLIPTVGETGGPGYGPEVATQVFNITLAQLQSAAGDGFIQVTATPSADVRCSCGDTGETPNQVTVTLEFPAT